MKRISIAEYPSHSQHILCDDDIAKKYFVDYFETIMKSILITGANRGIGLGLVQELVSKSPSPEFIFAGYRDANKSKVIFGIKKNIIFI